MLDSNKFTFFVRKPANQTRRLRVVTRDTRDERVENLVGVRGCEAEEVSRLHMRERSLECYYLTTFDSLQPFPLSIFV